MGRIYLSPPDVGEEERKRLLSALESGWVAPFGPDLDAFEAELSAHVGRQAVALSSGTGALHLALIIAGVKPGDRVLVSTLTFAATANFIRYVGAEPVFVDSDRQNWNMDPDLLAEGLEEARKLLPKVRGGDSRLPLPSRPRTLPTIAITIGIPRSSGAGEEWYGKPCRAIKSPFRLPIGG